MHIQLVMLGEIFNPTMAVVSRGYDDMSARGSKLLGLDPVADHPRHFVRRSAVDHPATGNAAVIVHAVGIRIPYVFAYRFDDIHEHILVSGIPDDIARFLIGDRFLDLPDDFYSSVPDELIIKFHCMNIFYRRLLPSQPLRCHITCGVKCVPSLAHYYSLDLQFEGSLKVLSLDPRHGLEIGDMH